MTNLVINMMFFIFFAQVTFGKIFAVIEVMSEPTSTPKFKFDWNQQELRQITNAGLQQSMQISNIIKERYFEIVKNHFFNYSAAFIKNTEPCTNAFFTQIREIKGSDFEYPLKLTDLDQDFMLSPERACNRIDFLLKANERKFENFETYLKALEKKEKFEKLAGPISVSRLYELADSVISYQSQEKALPILLENDEISILTEIYYRYHDSLLYGSLEQAKLAFSLLLGKIVEFMKITYHKEKAQKFLPIIIDQSLFTAILHIFGLDYSPKSAGSGLFVELHKLSNKNSVRFYFEGKYIESEVCGLECNFEEFLKYLEGKTIKPSVEFACTLLQPVHDDFTLRYSIAFTILISLIFLAKYSKQITEWVNKLKSE